MRSGYRKYYLVQWSDTDCDWQAAPNLSITSILAFMGRVDQEKAMERIFERQLEPDLSAVLAERLAADLATAISKELFPIHPMSSCGHPGTRVVLPLPFPHPTILKLLFPSFEDLLSVGDILSGISFSMTFSELHHALSRANPLWFLRQDDSGVTCRVDEGEVAGDRYMRVKILMDGVHDQEHHFGCEYCLDLPRIVHNPRVHTCEKRADTPLSFILVVNFRRLRFAYFNSEQVNQLSA